MASLDLKLSLNSDKSSWKNSASTITGAMMGFWMSAGPPGKVAWLGGLKLTYPTALTDQKFEGSSGGKTFKFIEFAKKLATFFKTSVCGTVGGAGFFISVSIFWNV